MEINAIFVTLLLTFAGAFMSLLLNWYMQGHRISELNGRVSAVEQAERECLKREAALRERVTELEIKSRGNKRVRGERYDHNPSR